MAKSDTKKRHTVKPMMSEKNVKKVLGLKPRELLAPNVLFGIRMAVWLDKFHIIKEDGIGYYLLYDNIDSKYGLSAQIYRHRLRGECVAIRNKLIDTFQRHHTLVKRDLSKEWGKRVRERDGNQCIMCGETDRLAAHHWCRGDHRSKMATWCIDNGIALCYSCHIGDAHQTPDWLLYNAYAQHIMKITNQGPEFMENIKKLSETEVCNKVVRKLWYDWGLHDTSGKYAEWDNQVR